MLDVKNEDSFLKKFAELSFVITIFLYFAGWIYIYEYFNYFGLSIRELEVDFYYVLIYSLNVFFYLFKFDNFITTLLLVATIITIVFLVMFQGNRKIVPWVSCFILFFFLYHTSMKAGRDEAKAARMYKTSLLRKVAFVLKDTTTSHPAFNLLRISNRDRKLRLLAVNKDAYFVIIADPGILKERDLVNHSMQLFTVKKDEISLIKLTN